jgi:toxin FitB
MYLVDTNVLSEDRRGKSADAGVRNFMRDSRNPIYLPVQAIGELKRGIEALIQRGDLPQAMRLQAWFEKILQTHSGRILDFDTDCALVWGKLMGASDQNPLDRQIAAIALVYDLTVVTRNTRHYAGTGARVLNPFLADAAEAE